MMPETRTQSCEWPSGTLTRKISQMRSPEESKLFWRLGLYSVVLVVCWIFGTAIRIHNSLTTDRRIFSLYVGHAILGHCQGFLNFCVYGAHPVLVALCAPSSRSPVLSSTPSYSIMMRTVPALLTRNEWLCSQ